jgi:coenzyme PQQ synthesis protein D (PqqD)
MDWDMRPERASGIEVREVTDGYVAYDSSRDRLHFLNLTATLLLESCDGNLRARELAELLAAAFRLEEPPLGEVEVCLARLLDEGLLVCNAAPLAR